MRNQRYSPAFEDEAVRQIVERGYSVADLSERLGVSAHSLYKRAKAAKPDRSEEQAAALIEDQRLLGLIRASYTASGGVYGAPRIFLDLREAGETCGKNRVARIMRVNKIRALRG